MRILTMILVLTLLLTGCENKNTNELDSKKLDEYKSVYESLLTSTASTEKSSFFDISTEVTHLPDNTYRYYVIVDNATISMYDVKMMAIELGTDSDRIMAPSIGILEDDNYNLIPSQVSMKEGFVKGLVLSGDSNNPVIQLKLMVSWLDETGKTNYKEFYDITCSAPDVQEQGS